MKLRIENIDKSPLKFYALEAGDVFIVPTAVGYLSGDVFMKMNKDSQPCSQNAISLKTGRTAMFSLDTNVKFYDGEVVLKMEDFII